MNVRRFAITLLLSGVVIVVPTNPALAYTDAVATQLVVTTPPATTSPTTSTEDDRRGMPESDAGVPVWVWILISTAVLVAGAFVAARLSGPGPRDL